MLKGQGRKYQQLEDGRLGVEGDELEGDEDGAGAAVVQTSVFEIDGAVFAGDSDGEYGAGGGGEDSAGLVPRDRANLCYLAYFSLGTGVLFPWNAFINATDYFQSIFEGKHVDRSFSVTYMAPNLLVLGLLLVLPRGCLGLTSSGRIYFGFALYVLCLSVPFLTTDWNLTLAGVAVAGLADGVAQGSVFGSVSALPARNTQAVVSGTSVSGLVISLLRIATKLAVPRASEQGLRSSTFLYFGVAGAFCIFCIFVQALLPRLPVYRHYHRHEHEHESEKKKAAGEQLKLEGSPRAARRQPSSLWDIFRITWPLAGGLFLSYCVTLSIFPGVLSEDLESERLGDWYPLLLFALFNAMDFLGKSSPIYPSFRVSSPTKLFALTLVRLVFYALYVHSTPIDPPHPPTHTLSLSPSL